MQGVVGAPTSVAAFYAVAGAFQACSCTFPLFIILGMTSDDEPESAAPGETGKRFLRDALRAAISRPGRSGRRQEPQRGPCWVRANAAWPELGDPGTASSLHTVPWSNDEQQDQVSRPTAPAAVHRKIAGSGGARWAGLLRAGADARTRAQASRRAATSSAGQSVAQRHPAPLRSGQARPRLYRPRAFAVTEAAELGLRSGATGLAERRR